MKKLLKKLIVPTLSWPPISTLAERFVEPGIPVFMCHRFNSPEESVSGHDIEYLHDCLLYLKENGYNFISIEQLVKALKNEETLPSRSVAFTIDDGFLDHAKIAAPVFIKHQCPVTIFLISGMLDGELWPWDDKVSFLIKNATTHNIALEFADSTRNYNLDSDAKKHRAISSIQNWLKSLDATDMDTYLNAISDSCNVALPDTAPVNYQAMNWDHARKLEQQGVYFAPHSRTHRILSRLNDSDSINEIEHSWKRMKEELVSPSPVFCYPTGRKDDFSGREINNIKKAGLIGAVTTEPTFVSLRNRDPDYLYELPRFGFPDNILDFMQYSSWIERAKAHNN